MDGLYPVLLVDDEMLVIQRLRRAIDWETHGFFIAGEAANGKQALELLQQYAPKLCIVDIEMPYKNGLDFSREAKQLFPDVEIVLLTGYDSFKYAREALRLHVTDYILKPLNPGEFSSVLQQIRQRLDTKQKEQHRQLWDVLVREHTYSPKLHEQLMKTCSFQEGMCWQAVYEDSPEDAFVFPLKQGVVSCRAYRGDRFVCRIIGAEKPVKDHVLLGLRGRISCSQGWGAWTDTWEQIGRSVDQAAEALRTARLIEGGSILRWLDIAEYEPETEKKTRQLLHRLEIAFVSRTIDEIRTAVGAHFQYCAEHQVPFRYVYLMLTEIYLFFSHLLRDKDYSLFCELYPDRVLSRAVTYQEIQDDIIRLAGNMYELFESADSGLSQQIIRAKSFIEENFHNPALTLDIIADHSFLNPAYFSSLFKRETGMTVIEYLTNCRMQHAVKLMLEGESALSVLAERVGYTDPYYFSKLFKKVYGESPTMFMKKRT